jgi:lactate permease
LFVVTIIWTSVFLYNIVAESGAVRSISSRMSRLVREPLLQCLLLAWCLSGFIQGITGFGVPVAIVAPLMLASGFEPVTAAAATLVGHAWSVTFGSMAGSFYTLQLVTNLPARETAYWTGAMLFVPTVLTGFAVAHVFGGTPAMARGVLPVLVTGTVMGLLQWALPVLGAPQIGSVAAGLAGTVTIVIISRVGSFRGTCQVESQDGSQGGHRDADVQADARPLNLHLALTPYYLLIAMALAAQVPPLKQLGKTLAWGVDYPSTSTALGFATKAERAYAAISLISHPAPLLVASALAAIVVYTWSGHLTWRSVQRAWATTACQCVPTTVSIATMVMMALVMNDTGMTSALAGGIAPVAGKLFPLVSPYIGVLGCFMTGSNTNSNVLFGAFQVETALALGTSTRIMAAVQSAGGSLGSAIAPAKVLIGSSTTGLTGREEAVMRKAIPYCMLIVLALGVISWLSVYVLFPQVM